MNTLAVLWGVLTGCCPVSIPGVSLPGATPEPGDDRPPVPGEKGEVRERKPLLLLPGTNSEPPPPTPAVTAEHCSDVTSGGPVGGGDCVTQRISCGETVIGHTRGGVDRFSTRWYEQNACWPGLVDHDGGDERVYRLDMPEGEWRAFVYLDSPCADLDLIALRSRDGTCPSPGESVTHCEANLVERVGREKVELVHQGSATWLLVVEGAGDDEGLFALNVMCREGLR